MKKVDNTQTSIHPDISDLYYKLHALAASSSGARLIKTRFLYHKQRDRSSD